MASGNDECTRRVESISERRREKANMQPCSRTEWLHQAMVRECAFERQLISEPIYAFLLITTCHWRAVARSLAQTYKVRNRANR